MIRLGLIGKDIGHSKSKDVYEELLGREINYTLFDFATERELPTLSEIFSECQGISITSPYKSFYLDNILNAKKFQTLKGINTVRITEKGFEGENTDYLAVLEMLGEYLKKYPESTPVVLGDGVMATVTKVALKNLSAPFLNFSRKTNGDLSLIDYYELLPKKNNQLFLINACSRDFVFKGKLSSNTIFWDYNYDFSSHNHLKSDLEFYIDGFSLLKRQALHALNFWGIT